MVRSDQSVGDFLCATVVAFRLLAVGQPDSRCLRLDSIETVRRYVTAEQGRVMLPRSRPT